MVLQVTCEWGLAYIPLLFASELKFGSFATRDASRCIIFSTPSKCSHTTCGYNNHTFTIALPASTGLDQLYHSSVLYPPLPYWNVHIIHSNGYSWLYWTVLLWDWSVHVKIVAPSDTFITLKTLMSVHLSVSMADISLKLLQTYGHIRKHSLHC